MSKSWLSYIPALILLGVVLSALVPLQTARADPGDHMLMYTGSYRGDGQGPDSITGVGFEPDVVFIKTNVAYPGVFRTSTMDVGDSKAATGGTELFTDRIQSFQSDGFTIGSNDDVNKTGTMSYWVAFKAAAGELKVGTYTGDGETSQDITDVGFQPAMVIVMSAADDETVFRCSVMSANLSCTFDGTDSTDCIKELLSNGFRVGSDFRVNENATTYHYIVWKAVTGRMVVNSYLGDGQDDRSISGVGFEPDWVIVDQKEPAYFYPPAETRHKSASTEVNRSQRFDNHLNEGNRIQALEADGFQVGNAYDVNTDEYTYWYMAFNVQWDSYSGTGTYPTGWTRCDSFIDSTNHVYMRGDGFSSTETLKVGYYDGAGILKEQEIYSGGVTGGILDLSECILNQDWGGTLPAEGTWHAVVFQTTDSLPPTYAEITDYIVDDDFYVYASAIPEFPTVMAAVVVAGLCFGIYYRMRKRRLAYVKA